MTRIWLAHPDVYYDVDEYDMGEIVERLARALRSEELAWFNTASRFDAPSRHIAINPAHVIAVEGAS